MDFTHRRLPHTLEIGAPMFLTWRLNGSLPGNRRFTPESVTAGKVFAAMDRLLDEARTGPFYMRRPEIARMVVEAIYYNADVLAQYILHAYCVMPNHVHLLITPKTALSKLTRSLKGITAKRGNEMLGLTGNPFWQRESYDHTVRAGESDRIKRYIELNPVRAGLVVEPEQYRWSSAFVDNPPAEPGGSAQAGGPTPHSLQEG